MNYVLYNARSKKYFKNGDFTVDNKSEASPLTKDKAEELMNMLNGITMSKPVKIERM